MLAKCVMAFRAARLGFTTIYKNLEDCQKCLQVAQDIAFLYIAFLWVDFGLGWPLTVTGYPTRCVPHLRFNDGRARNLQPLSEDEQPVMQSVTSDSIYGFSLRLACESVATA